jgi:hypothetical protein
MSASVCLAANTLGYPEGGGHLWAYLNWALGLQVLGCQVIWLEAVDEEEDLQHVAGQLARLREHLAPYGLADSIALFAPGGSAEDTGCPDLETATEADVLLNFRYGMPADAVRRFNRAALIDIDPGLLQWWMVNGLIRVAEHDAYFTIGERVGDPSAPIPDTEMRWLRTMPPVALDRWPPVRVGPEASFTTVSHWYEDEWMDDGGMPYRNDKQTAFLPYLDLPGKAPCRLELALCLAPDEDGDRAMLKRRGWSVRHAYDVSSTPEDYQDYVRGSLGEFSCAKPSYVRLDTAWVSDRTVCYLASGKPAVVQYTGPSRYLPDAEGMFRFRDESEAARALETAITDYDRQCDAARALAEEYFDARRVVGAVLERVLA